MPILTPIFECTERYLFRPLPGVIQQTTALYGPLHQLLPAALHAEQQVLDQDHILFLAEVLQVCPCLVQFNDVVSVGVHLCHKHLHKSSREERGSGQVLWCQKGAQAFHSSNVGHLIDMLMSCGMYYGG